MAYSPFIFTEADWRVLGSLEVRNLGALEGLTDDMSKQIIRELSDGINAGEGMDKLSKRIQEATNMASTRATTIARTETINAAVDGARIQYEQAGITEFEFVAATDERTCTECASLNGKIFKLTDNAHMPPLHPNCRCAIAPIVGNRKAEIQAAEKRRAEEAARKAKEEATLKEKQKADAAAAKAKREAELKKIKEEKEAAERKAREAEYSLKKQDPLLSLERGNKNKAPVIPYPLFKSPANPRPNRIKEPKEISGAVKSYTMNYFKAINRYLRRVTGKHGWKEEFKKNRLTEDNVKKWVGTIDDDLSDKVIAREIEMLDGSIKEIPEIYRGLREEPVAEIVNLFTKYGEGENAKGISLFADEGFSSWTIDRDITENFASAGTITMNGKRYQAVLIETVEPGTHGYFIGTQSAESYEAEVLRARGLINVIESIKPFEKPNGITVLEVRTHLKRLS